MSRNNYERANPSRGFALHDLIGTFYNLLPCLTPSIGGGIHPASLS